MYETKHGLAGSKPKQTPEDISFIEDYPTMMTEVGK